MPLIVSSTGCPQVADKARRLLMPVLRYDSVFSLDDIQVKLAQTPQANRVLSSVQSFHSFHSLCTHTHTEARFGLTDAFVLGQSFLCFSHFRIQFKFNNNSNNNDNKQNLIYL